MGIAERRGRERAGVRARILEASRAIAIAEGASAITMRKIAERIEYSAASIYQHFESREAIVRELCRDGYGELLASVAPAAAVPDPLERLVAIGRAYVRFGMANPELYRLMFMEDAALTTALYGALEEADGSGRVALAALTGALDELVAAGRIDRGANTARLADAFWAAVHGIVSLKIACPHFPESPAEELTDTTIALLLHGALTRPLPLEC
jgi:AcrR family transcriptional regulator